MYVPAPFDESRPDVLRALIVRHPFGSLITHGKNGLDANHLPFELLPGDGGLGELHAHVARANPVWQEVANGDDVLVIFRAGDAYISPNWYPSKHAAHRQVPTWNYVVVHAHGRITVRDDEKFVRGVVARLTRTHEGRTGDPRPWKMGDSSPEYIEEMLGKIVGVEIAVTKLVGKWKLSQNREARDRVNAAEALRQRGEAALAGEMLNYPKVS